MDRTICRVLAGLAVLVVAACTSDDADEAATAGTPDAYCPALVELAVESALASDAVGSDAGPNAVNGPEFARTREVMGELLAAAPDRVRDLAAAASYDPSAGESANDAATIAMWQALAALAPACAGEQTAACTTALADLRQAASATALDPVSAVARDACAPPPHLDTGGDCGLVSIAVLLDDGDTERPIIERAAASCFS